LRHSSSLIASPASRLRCGRLTGASQYPAANPWCSLPLPSESWPALRSWACIRPIETSGFLGDRVDESYLSVLDLVLLDIKSSNPDTYHAVTGRDLAPTLRFAERLASIGKPVWVRFTLVPGFTDDAANVEGIAKFVAPMKNVQWVEVQPFHQLGAFKWKAMNLEYKNANTPTPAPDLIARVIEQFRTAGCPVR
jgi:pyruvate formate lyase activating enzyme